MPSSPSSRSWLSLVLLFAPLAATAQEGGMDVRFETVDEVELHGTFYPSAMKMKATTVLLLPGLGAGETESWDGLAKDLQQKGMAVLVLDFRGHGKSTTVSPAFWKVTASKQIKGAGKKQTLVAKDMPPSYLPMLVNDVAAARRFLDEKNDAKECNSANMIVVGAQEGATLGLLWLASEWKRNPPRGDKNTPKPDPYGHDVAGAVWLTLSPTLAKQPVPVEKWVKPLRDKTPMAFFYGEDDKKAAGYANELCEKVLTIDTPPRAKFTAGKAIKGKGVGHELLQKSLGTNDSILAYISKVMEARGESAWAEREIKKVKVEFVGLKSFGFPLP